MSKDLAPSNPNAEKRGEKRRVTILLVKDPLWAPEDLQMETVGMVMLSMMMQSN